MFNLDLGKVEVSIPWVNVSGVIAPDYKGLRVALGNFDGVHLGHQALLRAVQDKTGPALAVLTFNPNPKRFFLPDSPPNRLMRSWAIARKLGGLGVHNVFEVSFDRNLSNMTDHEFIASILVDQLAVNGVIVGEDFRFGRGRMGDIVSLRKAGKYFGFEVDGFAPLEDDMSSKQDKISSSTIRNHLREGDVRAAAALLGHAWVMDGEVVTGQKQGRRLGFPTANLAIDDLLHPKYGVYAVKIRQNKTGPWRDGVANFGRTPTTGLRGPLLEAHIFDFDHDIYGEWLEIALISFLRPERKFDTLDAMISKMHDDCSQAKAILDSHSVAMPQ